MKVFFPATAAVLATSVWATGAEARAGNQIYSADIVPPAAAAEREDLARIEKLARTLGDAQQAICKNIEIYSRVPWAVTGADYGNKVVVYPNIGHFSHGTVTFEPTKISIDWTDKSVDGETGFSSPLPGVTQTIDLINESGIMTYEQGFEGGGLRDSYGHALNCSTNGAMTKKGLSLEVQCSDSLAQRTVIEVKPDIITLTYRFELAISPLDNAPVDCIWDIERPSMVIAP